MIHPKQPHFLFGLIGIGLAALIWGFLLMEQGLFEVGFLSIIFGTIVTSLTSTYHVSKIEKKRKNKGIIQIWIVCLLAIVVMALAWFTLSWPAYVIIEKVTETYSFPAEALGPINLVKNVIGWFLVFFSLGLLSWAFLASLRREAVTEPVYV